MSHSTPLTDSTPLPKVAKDRRRTTSDFLGAGILLLLVAFALPPIPAAEASSDVLSTDTLTCKTPASTPACASKTWDDCRDYNDPALCAEIGRPDMEFWEVEVSDGQRSVTFTKLAPRSTGGPFERGPVLGVSEVSSDRFNWFPQVTRGIYVEYSLYDPFIIAPELRGTHEVKHGWLIDGKVYDAYSRFFRKDGDRWVLTSWTWHFNEVCDHSCLRFHPECKFFIEVMPWNKWAEEERG